MGAQGGGRPRSRHAPRSTWLRRRSSLVVISPPERYGSLGLAGV